MNTGYSDGALDIHRQELGQFTAEEIVRNFYGLYRRKEVDETGNVVDIDDDMRNDQKLRASGVYDYLISHKDALARYGVSEETMNRLFPYVQFNKVPVSATTETDSQSGLSPVSDDTPAKGKTRGRKASASISDTSAGSGEA